LLTIGRQSDHVDNLSKQDPESLEMAGHTVPTRGWRRYLTGWEAGIWLLSMWVFGAVITAGLLSFNLAVVRNGDPLLPYFMAGVGYTGLLMVTLLFVWRFISSLTARSASPA